MPSATHFGAVKVPVAVRNALPILPDCAGREGAQCSGSKKPKTLDINQLRLRGLCLQGAALAASKHRRRRCDQRHPEGGSLPRRTSRATQTMALTLELEVTISYLIDFDHETGGEAYLMASNRKHCRYASEKQRVALELFTWDPRSR